MKFRNRTEAGRQLAEQLSQYAARSGVLVLGLPRGGVPVAYEVAVRLQAPLDVFLVRKLGVPGREELAMGAIASGGTNQAPVRVLNEAVIRAGRITDEQLNQVTEREGRELERRERAYRSNHPAPVVAGKTVILIDDGLATGATMRAAILALRAQRPAELIVALPVASAEVCAELLPQVDAIVCVQTPEPFYGVGQWYDDFSQTTDEQVNELLRKVVR